MGDILYLVHRVPYPPDRGDKIRSYNILKRLTELGTVHLATFADDDADMAHGEALRAMLRSLHIEKRTIGAPVAAFKALATGKPVSLTSFDSAGIRAYVQRVLTERPVKAVFVFSGQMAQFVPELSPDVTLVTDICDVDSAKFASYADTSRGPMRAMYGREARKLAAFEREIARRSDHSLFVSAAEADLFRAQAGLDGERVLAVENGIDCAFFDPEADFEAIDRPEGRLIAFTGQMDYHPNIEAVVSFASEVMPAIRAAEPAARFVIVGRNPAPEVARLAEHDGVIVTGGVPDIRSWLAAADVVVAPLRMARGIQNKVLEAMAMARPVVASAPAFEGIDARAGEHLLVADDPAEERRHVLDLLADTARAQAMGAAGRTHVQRRYVWGETLAPLGRLLGIEEAEPAAVALAGAG